MLAFTPGHLSLQTITAMSAYDLSLDWTHKAICCSKMLQQFVVSCVPALTCSIISFIRFDAILLVCFLENILYSSVCIEDKGKLAHLPLNIRYTPELQNEPHQAISSFVPSHFFNLQCSNLDERLIRERLQ